MIDYILYGEFDINQGNDIKIEYPTKTGVNETILPSYLIPDGGHNNPNDTFCFIINKNIRNEDSIVPGLKESISKYSQIKTTKYFTFANHPIYLSKVQDKGFKLINIYTLNSFRHSWDTLKTLETQGLTDALYIKIDIDKKEQYYKFVIYTMKPNDVLDIKVEIPIHSDIQFKKLQPKFASVYTLNSQGFGFEFSQEEDLDIIDCLINDTSLKLVFAKTEEDSWNKIVTNTSNIINKDKDIYFLCSTETKLDKSMKRGAIMKSIAIGTTKLINLNSFKSPCRYLLDNSFSIHNYSVDAKEKIEIMRRIIESTYKAFNSIEYSFGLNMTRYEKSYYAYLEGRNYFNIGFQCKKDIKISLNESISVDLALADNEEKLFPGSLIDLITIFGKSTMTIYDAILNDQRILFLGEPPVTCQKLSSCVFATLSMIGPLAFGFIKRLHPYKNLYDLDFLKVSSCIYAVTNPIFKNSTDRWDVLCEVKTGLIAISEKYKQLTSTINKDSDNKFINEIIYKIKNEYITEYEVQNYFTKYTFHLLKITGEKYFSDDKDLNDEINKQSKRKIAMNKSLLWKIEIEYEKFRGYISFNGTTFNIIERHVNNLYNRKDIDKEELSIIYSDIENFIQGGDLYIFCFLWLLLSFPNDFQFIFNGLFAKHPEIRSKVKNVYNILSKNQHASKILKKMNVFYLMKLNELEKISNGMD